ncbi:DUF5590 domain-containing protein [Lentilactobacillus diolivorans]|uniref:cell wall elongation regulator TseB-like domain-containing protein n=1 Tax=Lentilactobacillus diolivorans TaxID=179838 RepID=UPI0024692750|nr:DUF5590 domain-containing protein [Lentilactobacillus diolivorans]MDH5105907.1 DUF5590 domain-containing protein [Lentilactobacillus diolivorans]
MQRQRRIKKQSKVKVSWIITLVILILLFAGFVVLHEAQKPMVTAKNQTVTLAKKYADLKTVEAFYASNLGKTYYSVAGTTNKQKPIYVIVAKKGGNVTVVDQSSGLSEQRIRNLIVQTKQPKKINSISLTLIKNKPYWVVSYLNSKSNLCYATLSFKTGTVKKLIENI